MIEKILEIKNLKKYYGKRDSITKALDGISFKVMNGEFIGIMGTKQVSNNLKIKIATNEKCTNGLEFILIFPKITI